MNIFEEVFEYLTREYSIMSDYTEDEDVFYKVAFLVLTIIFTIGIFAVYVFLFLTSPIWIIPYLIYRAVKEKRGCRE